MAIKASLVSSIQVRTYGTKLYWVVVCLKNGRALQGTKDAWEVLAIEAAALRNGVEVVRV
jgi:hypothetical protein